MTRRFIRYIRLVAIAGALLGGAMVTARALTPAPTVRAASTDVVQLVDRCNNIALTWAAGTPLTTVASAITPASGLDAIWRYDNAQARFFGFSTLPGAPNDYTSILMRLEPVFVCMRAAGQIDRPTV